MRPNLIFFLVVTFMSFRFGYSQQITTDATISLEQLIQQNLGQNCVEISNITSSVNGAINGLNSYGYFERGDSNFPFENGILLTTGNVNSAGNTLNSNPLNEGNPTWLTDIDLENALGITNTQNATSIQFNFISVANQIQFNYLLASEEYQQEFPCFYSDGFAFLIREAGTSSPYSNIALVPGTNIPVNTNTIHDQIEGFCAAENESFFEGYNLGDTNYNGRTTVLTATAAIQPNIEYQIKLIIADQTDINFDSAVFIEGNSFNATVDLGPDITTCGDAITINGDIQNPQASYSWYKDDALLSGESNPTLNVLSSGTYRVEVMIQLNATSCVIEDTIEITLDSEQSSTQISDIVYCDDESNDGVESFDLSTKDNEVLASVPPSNYNITYHYTSEDAENSTNSILGSIQNTSSPQPIFVRIEDIVNGCLAFSTFNLVVNEKPDYQDPDPIITCIDITLDGYTLIDLNVANDQITNGNPNLYISYHYSAPEADTGYNPIFSPYANLNTDQTLYVRVYDALTGCFSTTTISVEIQDLPPINTDDQWINACEEDDDGFEIFDLTSVIDDVLQGSTGLDLSFHETEFDAQNNLNPIVNPEEYQNATEGFQLLYIRVEDPTTGCFNIVKLGLYANIIKTLFSGEVFIVCDDMSNDGIADFDLNAIEIELKDGFDEFEIQFFATPEDRTNTTNEIDKTVPFNVTNSGTTIYAFISDGDCSGDANIELQIASAVALTPQSVDYCDEDNDGFTTLIMDTFNSVALQGVQAGNVKFYLTEEDALNNENILPDYFYNTTNPQLFYVRVTNAQTECYDISTLEVNIVNAPNILYPEPIIICDDDADGVSTVNLNAKIPELVTSTSGLDFSFYTNYNDAIEAENAITDSEFYTTESQYIYARVENEITSCYSLSGFHIYVNTIPEFIPITNFENCEADITGVADFYFYLKDEEILNGQPDKQVLYYETELDALAGNNPIDKYAVYNNTSSPQTIYVRVESYTDSDCFSTSSFDIEVGSIPIFNAAESIFVCDDISNDGIITIDLNDKIAEMIADSPETLEITFHESANDATNNTNPVPLLYTNTTNPQELYARVDNGNYCKGISAFDINVISAPLVNTSTPLAQCDDNYDGIVTWDLTVSEIEILGVRQDNIEITYFETIEDLEAHTNPISNPENYNNISNPQTAYVKINNTLSNCFVNVPLDLIVNLPPPFNDFEVYEICDNPTHSFDLSEIASVIINPDTAAILSYYTTYNDAINSTNSLTQDYTYQTSNDIIFVRIEHPDTGCFYIYDFRLQINPLPIANTPNNIEVCDDASNDGIATFHLEIQTQTILGTQSTDDFTVSYHLNLTDAEAGDNPIASPYNSTNQTIFVRVENNDTSCYSLTSFSLIVDPHPNIPNPILECDTDYDARTTFNLTTAENELFTIANPDHIISYYESLDDLEADQNPIMNPTQYANISNPQTVYIKVLNTVGDCFTFVPLELQVNLPPATNTFEVYDICANEDNTFDLSTINDVIVDTNYNVLFSYFTSEADAIANLNALDTNYTYTNNSTTIYARIEFSTTHCYYIYPFTLHVNPLPIANQPSNLVTCDDDYDGYYEFNLEAQTAQILGFQNPTNYSVTYFNNSIDASDGSNSLDASSYYGYHNEMITARIENNTTSCFSLVDFLLIVNRKPNVNIPNQVVCVDNLPLVVSADTSYSTDRYTWSTNQIGSEIEITEIGTYSITVTSENGCITTSTFNVTASESATIELTETVDFSDPNNITITISGIGNYQYILDDNAPQTSNVFENVSLGYHTVTIIDLNGCAEVTKEVVVVDAPPFFTPNGDTENDTWHIVGIETLPGSRVYIFNRYGKLIEQLGSSTQGWDGTYNGKNLPAADYWFLAEIKQGQIAFEVKGHFALRR